MCVNLDVNKKKGNVKIGTSRNRGQNRGNNFQLFKKSVFAISDSGFVFYASRRARIRSLGPLGQCGFLDRKKVARL
ncbi:hypothetical protein NQ317_000018 [Molorchus minor]|uniref:Ribosomal protein L14 n=1 Tax=Molorchus minor TaxID=1323400 RepID=A0ABQ9JBR0_9CUCU|nr:hypothetical protein NQ317_000018 [Molorchus minor]